MLRIAICDDEKTELESVSALTREYLAQCSFAAEVQAFTHPDALLTACENARFHIFLLDMLMPMVSGLELGQCIRKTDTDAQIIYITAEPGFALDAYAVNPLHYLLKPVEKAALFATLKLAAKKVDYGAALAVTVRTKAGLRTLSAEEILCCEYSRHRVVYTLFDGEQLETTTLPGSFTEHIAPLLEDRRFLQPHAAFAVNMSFVVRLDKTGFMLRGGAFVPISGKQLAAVRDAYMNYRLGK